MLYVHRALKLYKQQQKELAAARRKGESASSRHTSAADVPLLPRPKEYQVSFVLQSPDEANARSDSARAPCISVLDAGFAGYGTADGNSSKSADKHGVGQAEAEQVFLNTPLLLLDDPEHSTTERRYHAYGKTHAGRLLQIAFTLRQDATLLRIISVRPMSAKERTRHAQET